MVKRRATRDRWLMVSRRTDVDIVDKVVVVVDDDSVGIGIVVNVIDVII